jgi:hypothetical protein
MKLFSVKKLERLYFEVKCDLKTMTYSRQFTMRKGAYITFLGIPLYATKHVFIDVDKHIFAV